jgi:hypothetical protein
MIINIEKVKQKFWKENRNKGMRIYSHIMLLETKKRVVGYKNCSDELNKEQVEMAVNMMIDLAMYETVNDLLSIITGKKIKDGYGYERY